MPANVVLAKNQVATITAKLYETTALPVVFIDLDRLYYVGHVLNTYLLFPGCPKLQIEKMYSQASRMSA